MGVLIPAKEKTKHKCDLPQRASRGDIYWCDCRRKYKCTNGNKDFELMELHWSRRFRWFGPPSQIQGYHKGQQRVNSSKPPPPTLAYPPAPPPPKYKEGGPVASWFMPPVHCGHQDHVNCGQSRSTVDSVELHRDLGPGIIYIQLRETGGAIVDKTTVVQTEPVMISLDFLGEEIVGIELIGEPHNENES